MRESIRFGEPCFSGFFAPVPDGIFTRLYARLSAQLIWGDMRDVSGIVFIGLPVAGRGLDDARGARLAICPVGIRAGLVIAAIANAAAGAGWFARLVGLHIRCDADGGHVRGRACVQLQPAATKRQTTGEQVVGVPAAKARRLHQVAFWHHS